MTPTGARGTDDSTDELGGTDAAAGGLDEYAELDLPVSVLDLIGIRWRYPYPMPQPRLKHNMSVHLTDQLKLSG